ncbi:hypothetical protein [Streptomyces sp. NPDC005143]
MIAATPSVLAAARADGVAYMRLPQRVSRNERIGGRDIEFLRVPMDVFRRQSEVQGA